MSFRFLPFIVLLAGCAADSGAGPDPIRPQRYFAERLGDKPVPTNIWGGYRIDSAFLIPYAVGRTIDQRLVNDRTGGGTTGGNTRDTTVARGQFIDLRIISGVRDSNVVDAVIYDTVMIITRPHPDPARVRVDTGWFVGGQLVMPTVIDYLQKLPFFDMLERCPVPMAQSYQPYACRYHTELGYKLQR